MGDVYALVASRAIAGDRIAIVDGVFEQVPAVWHKEILFALECGVAVYGASSMGALRAAELYPFGMRGHGRIFAAFRDGGLDDDDEVAIAHATGDAGYRPLSDAMVSLRFGLEALCDEGAITAADCSALTAASKARHYSARSWGAVVADARMRGLDEAAVAALQAARRRFDVKGDDARSLLDRLAAECAVGPAEVAVDFVLERTSFWTSLVAEREAAASTSVANEDSAIIAQVRACGPDRATILRAAALLRLAATHTRDWTPGPKELTAAAFDLVRTNSLENAAALGDWRGCHGLSDESDWRETLDLQARAAVLIDHLVPGADRYILTATKLAGTYAQVRKRSRMIAERFGADRTKQMSLIDAGVAPESLQVWYERRCGRMSPDPEAHALRLGFATLRDFLAELLPAYLVETQSDDSPVAVN